MPTGTPFFEKKLSPSILSETIGRAVARPSPRTSCQHCTRSQYKTKCLVYIVRRFDNSFFSGDTSNARFARFPARREDWQSCRQQLATILHAQPRNTATHQALLGQRKATVARKTSSEANRSSVETALLRPSSCSPPRLPSAPAAAHAASSRARDRSMTSQHRRRQALLAGARATRRRTASISSSERRQLRMMPFVLLGSRISTGE